MRIVLFVCCVVLISCEKNIDFSLKRTQQKPVIEASIENDVAPVVVLTTSFDYYSKIDTSVLANLFIHGADISISDGIITEKLKEYSISTSAGANFFYYSTDTSNRSSLKGKLGMEYKLTISTNNELYQAATTIPLLNKTPDSLWWKPAPLAKHSDDVIVMAKATDPKGLGNFIRYYTKRNDGPFLASENSVFDDQFIDGTTYSVPVDPGKDRNADIKIEDNYFKRGDTVTLKLCNIDKATYQFWLTMEFAYQSIGNPFASPNKVLGNISNGGLGSFCGYGTVYQTIIIPK